MTADYDAAPWEELDAPKRMWAVFGAESDSNHPLAIFQDELDCDEWIAWQRSKGDECVFGGCDIAVCAVDGLEGHVWNDMDPPPAAD